MVSEFIIKSFLNFCFMFFSFIFSSIFFLTDEKEKKDFSNSFLSSSRGPQKVQTVAPFSALPLPPFSTSFAPSSFSSKGHLFFLFFSLLLCVSPFFHVLRYFFYFYFLYFFYYPFYFMFILIHFLILFV